MTEIIHQLMLLMLIPSHVSRTCWTNIGLILNMIGLINVCYVTRIHRLCLFPVNLILILIHPKRNKIITPYKLHNIHLLSPVEHYKYLGVIIQNDLKWHLHIQSITAKASQMFGLLKRNLRTSYTNLRERAYISV